MLELHHLNSSRSMRILWMLEEIAIPYTIVQHQRLPSMLAPDSLKAVHPLGKAPVIRDGGRTIAESGMIVEYLAKTYAPHLLPPEGSDARLRHDYWMHYAEGSAAPPLVMRLIFGFMGEAAGPMAAMMDMEIAKHFAFMSGELGDQPFFAGEALTACDFMMVFPLEMAQARFGITGYPSLEAYVQRIHARPAYQRALERGGANEVMTPQ